MNKLARDLDLSYNPIKFDHDRRRIAPRRVVTGLAGQKNWSARYALTKRATSPMNELRDLDPRYVPFKFDCDRRRIAPGRAVTGLLLPQTDRRTDGQPDSSIPPFIFVERGITKQSTTKPCVYCIEYVVCISKPNVANMTQPPTPVRKYTRQNWYDETRIFWHDVCW